MSTRLIPISKFQIIYFLFRCWVAGWGRDHQGGEFSAIQRKVDVPLVDRQTCQCSLREALRQKTGDNNVSERILELYLT